MKPLNEPKTGWVKNAKGGYNKITEQAFQVEPKDVGTFRHHFLGFNYRSHRFEETEVGCSINVQWDETGWTNWVFALNWDSEPCKKLH